LKMNMGKTKDMAKQDGLRVKINEKNKMEI
jgi:hypothetical protein